MTTKKVERTGAPVVAQVPWGQQPAPEGLEDAADAFVEAGDVSGARPIFEPAMTDPIALTDANRFANQVKAAFSGEVIAQSSPFAPKAKAAAAPEPETFELGDAPSWGELVKFVQKHGKDIIQARYPQPRGVAVDTLYRGVTVFAYPTTEVRHVDLGWIPWEDAQYE